MIKKNMHALESKSREVFTELGYAKQSSRALLIVVRTLIRLHDEQGEEQLNNEIITAYVQHQEQRCQNGEIGKGLFLRQKTASEYLAQIYDTGTIINKRRKLLPKLSDYFEGILADILSNEERNYKYNKRLSELTSSFFRWLTSCGYKDLSGVDEHIVREYLTNCSSRMVGGSLDITRRALKNLFLFISEDGALSEPMNKLFLFSIPAEKKMKPFMPQDEIAAILNVIDRSTVRGKRDYAIILLATVTGLRAIDIAELTLDCISWRDGEIRIVQEKTGKALALPLTSDVGESIREYILNARPHNNSSRVFLSTKAPFGTMHSATLNSNLKNYRIKARLTTRMTFHSLRRSIATNMVTSGVSVITVAQTLGHSTINSTKQYISLDSPHLKECALDFSGIEIGGNVK